MPTPLNDCPTLDPAPSVDDALVSLLIYNYREDRLEECLRSIFDQNTLKNFEVIFCDDATLGTAWEVANRYALRHDGKITVSRNNIAVGKSDNRKKALAMCHGKYSVELTDSARFIPDYILQTVELMEADRCIEHSYIARTRPANLILPSHNAEKPDSPGGGYAEVQPLVRVCIYNYNYGRYLAQCLESVFAQTYGNVEISLSDNASTDESWAIARRFAEAHPGKISLTRNRANFGPGANLRNCGLNMRSKYVTTLCSDDVLHPEFIERCVRALELHPDAAFAMVHRSVIDERGVVSPEAPFYDCSCLIPGPEQAAVYMMSSVNPSVSQILYNVKKRENKQMSGVLNDRWFGSRIADFHACCESPIVYLRDALLYHRVHDASDSTSIEKNLLQCMGEYVLLQQLADIADSYATDSKASRRLDAAQNKLAKLSLRYCVRALTRTEKRLAKRYFHLAQAIAPEIEDDEVFRALVDYWDAVDAKQADILADICRQPNLVNRTVSYPPPPGSLPL